MQANIRIAAFLGLVMALGHCASVAGTGATVAAAPAPRGDESAGELVNRQRAAQGLAPLRADAALQRAAAGHVRDMERNNFMGHVSSNGATLRQRGNRQGYRACWYGEVVAFGQKSAAEVVANWEASPAHRRILLHRRAVEYGVARGPANAWVMVFAQPGCA